VKSYLDYKLNIVYLNRANFTSKAVLKTLDTLKTQPNDLIIWHYSGLGFYPSASRSKYPSFRLKDLKQRALSLDYVASLVAQKGVRLAWVMADLRNAFPKFKLVDAPLLAIEDIRKLIVEKLFLEPCGVLKLVSSQPNKPTYTNRRGNNSAFMFSFTRSFYDILNKTTVSTLRYVCVDSLLSYTQYGIENELKGGIAAHTEQVLRWELQPGSVALRASIKPARSFEGIPTQETLESLLNSLVVVVDKAKRQSIINSIRLLFDPDATIRVSTPNSPQPVQYSLKEFLQSLTNHNPKLIEYNFMPYDTQRNADFRQFKSLNLTQIIKN
jgi:hypothetical protein